jgi:hypothetical protein
MFGKRGIDHDIFTCEATASKLLNEPSEDVLSLAHQADVASSILDAAAKKRKLTPQEKKARDVKRSAFMACTASKVLNLAIKAHRQDYCHVAVSR